jgi:hypothetical protein
MVSLRAISPRFSPRSIHKSNGGRPENFIYADKNPYVGPNDVLEGVFMRLGNDWEGFAVAPKELLDAGETVITRG